MTTGDSQPVSAHPAQLQQLPLRDAPAPSQQQATSPPSKRDLASWWRQFKRNTKKEEEKAQPRGIFGVPLNVSIKYANVAISLTNDNGESFIYGYVPIVVAKCGVFLKEKATDVEGIFRLNGSAKRIKDLQEIFDSPERYGKGLDWTGYTVHDAANILRRYLNQLPEPIVPLDFYERFREPLRNHQAQAVGDMEAQDTDTGNFDYHKAVATYQQLIRGLPPLNRQLLLYILDLLAVFASKSEQNRMTSANLSAIFQPGLLSHPSHDMAPQEYKLSQDVLIFLIENQDHFLFGMNGTAADEQTVKDVEAGVAPPRPSTGSNIRRSVSSASGGAESVRKYEGLRRNVSVSSKNSRNSGSTQSPGTPTSISGRVHRSNTVPSKKSPGMPASRLGRAPEPTTTTHNTTSGGLAPPTQSRRAASRSPSRTPSPSRAPPPQNAAAQEGSAVSSPTAYIHTSTHGPIPRANAHAVLSGDKATVVTPTKERKLSSFFSKSPPPAGEQKEHRQPNRLKKKRIPGSASESAQSSSNSLNPHPVDHSTANSLNSVSQAPRSSPDVTSEAAGSTPKLTNTSATPPDEMTPQLTKEVKQGTPAASSEAVQQQGSENMLRPNPSRTPSMNSRSSFTDHSDFDQVDEASRSDKKEHRRSWRFPRSVKRSSDQISLGLASPPLIGINSGAEFSTSSISSSHRPRKSSTFDSQPPGTEASQSFPALDSELNSSSNNLKEASQTFEPEKKGFFGKFRAKVAQVKEGVKDWDSERERAKSPPHMDPEKSASNQNISYAGKENNKNGRRMSTEQPQENVDASQNSSAPSGPASGPPPAIPEEPASPVAAKAATEQKQDVVKSTAENAQPTETASNPETGKGNSEVPAQPVPTS
ncbi:hypothetical protein VTN00DRAFT_3428 [Thermoascus crustaceus]|uniref:uncharacterized protein n=1 Tax=Thermoascus crustaceus TaxID=5088 RepID=UPI003742633E